MWTFGSERGLAAAAWSSVAALFATALLFFWVQNTFRPVGGEISWAKLFWLMYAVLFWFVLPLLLVADPRLSGAWRRPFTVLAALMLIRGVIEPWMLYVALNWSPWYGIGHDIVCMATLAILGWTLRERRTGAVERTVFVHLIVTTALFSPEIYFAWYMQAHFTTTGESAIYFVPDDPRYSDVLTVTAAVVVFLSAYLPLFLYRWLHGATDRTRPATS
ncbi:MAG TPA: hypothetical protein VLB72_10545 [Burkholderiales bacterium]|nr:hypothetical protein [Burkholderiales bacterium]HXV09539.1 hypothetical protein [Burkholderiales bacterium]